jgi:hypothetical protein
MSTLYKELKQEQKVASSEDESDKEPKVNTKRRPPQVRVGDVIKVFDDERFEGLRETPGKHAIVNEIKIEKTAKGKILRTFNTSPDYWISGFDTLLPAFSVYGTDGIYTERIFNLNLHKSVCESGKLTAEDIKKLKITWSGNEEVLSLLNGIYKSKVHTAKVAKQTKRRMKDTHDDPAEMHEFPPKRAKFNCVSAKKESDVHFPETTTTSSAQSFPSKLLPQCLFP